MKVAGVDPGVSGAVALMSGRQVLGVYDCPIYKTEVVNARAKKTKKGTISRSHYDIDGMLLVAQNLSPLKLAIIEEVSTYGLDPMSASQLVAGMELWTMAFLAAGVDVLRVRPADWKKHFKLKVKGDKRLSLFLAREKHPEADDLLKFLYHHDRAEAILLADYGLDYLNGRPR